MNIYPFVFLLSILESQVNCVEFFDSSFKDNLVPETQHTIDHVKTVDDLKKELSSLPQSDVVSLKISFVKMNEIEPDIFQNFSSLDYLCLNENHIKTLDYENFDGMSALKRLDLRHNEIERFTGVFSEIKQLERIDLSYNKITSLTSHSLQDIPNLKYINLNNNQISKIHKGAFDGFKELIIDLEMNLIGNPQGEVFRDLSFKRLNLANNLITSLSDHKFVGSTIYSFELQNNKIDELLPENFEDLKILQELDLNRNLIASYDGAFINLKELQGLHLGENEIDVLPYRGFRGLNSLAFLSLYKNRITKLNADSFLGLRNVRRLILADNLIKYVDDEAFNGLETLSYLHLNGNKIKTLPALLFKNTPGLIYLELSKNKFKTLPSSYVYNGLPDLSYLIFSDNSIEYIPNTAFVGLKKFDVIDLSGNKIHQIESGTFSDVDSILYLKLGNNRFINFSLSAFEGLKSVHATDLQFNSIKSISVLESLPPSKYVLLGGNDFGASPPELDDLNLEHIDYIIFSTDTYKRDESGWTNLPYVVDHIDIYNPLVFDYFWRLKMGPIESELDHFLYLHNH